VGFDAFFAEALVELFYFIALVSVGPWIAGMDNGFGTRRRGVERGCEDFVAQRGKGGEMTGEM
jgi:hypothetical protein